MRYISFLKNNQTKPAEIAEAVAAGDVKLAHRLAHTLKGNAGLIGKTGLQNAAENVEVLLKDGTSTICENKMNILKTELERVLEDLRPLLDEAEATEKLKQLNAEQVLALFDKLEPMLENINPESVNMIDDIRAVPGAEELARYMEDYDFGSAARALAELRKRVLNHG